MMPESPQPPIVRRALPEDSHRVWEIRRHPEVVKASRPFETPFEDSDAWYQKKYFSDQDNHCFVLVEEYRGVIGYCRYDLDTEKDWYVLSIALDPDFHGKGLGHKLLSESAALLEPNKKVYAEVIRGNMPSFKLFEKNGYALVSEDENELHLIKES